MHKTANNSKQSEKSSIQEYSKVIAGVNAIRMNNKAVYTKRILHLYTSGCTFGITNKENGAHSVAGVRDILEKEHVSKDFDAYDDDTIYILESVCLQQMNGFAVIMVHLIQNGHKFNYNNSNLPYSGENQPEADREEKSACVNSACAGTIIFGNSCSIFYVHGGVKCKYLI
ncbi:16247_t:CDS:2 [Entrophospora sp. SA101]|nr:16247_t:CDS:2 [Entrophospora sp. SA101]